MAEQRKDEVLEQLREMGQAAYEAIEMGNFPEIALPSRSVKNIVYDENLKQFILGKSRVKRSSRNVKHIRPYTQLLWLAYFAQQLVKEKKTSTLRDVFYSAQAFNMEFADQNESDEIITDLETAMMKAREDFNIYPEERSAIFGNLTIEYTVPGYEGKRLDLSSHPDGVMIGPALTTAELVDTDAEMVLAIEKGGLFTRFVEEKVHERYKALLINTAGQPPRSTRYLLRRLHDEMHLPIGILCDADPWGAHIAMVIKSGSVMREEPIVVRDTSSGEVEVKKIGEFVDECIARFGFFNDALGNEVCAGIPFEVMTVDESNHVRFRPMSAAIRHLHRGTLYTLRTQSGRLVTVTPNHSVFVLRDGRIVSVPTTEMREGELLVVAGRTSEPTRPTALVDVVKELSDLPREANLPDLYVHVEGGDSKRHDKRRLKAFVQGKKVPKLAKYPDSLFVSSRGSNPADVYPARIWLSKEFARLLGYYTSEGWIEAVKGVPRSVNLSFGLDGMDVAEDAENCVKRVFPRATVQRYVGEGGNGITLRFGGTATATLFLKLCGEGFARKRVPRVLFEVDKKYVEEYLKGCFGDGYITDSGGLCWKMKNPTLVSELAYLMIRVGITPSISEDRCALIVSGRSEVSRLTSTILHQDDGALILQRIESTKTKSGSCSMPKAFPVLASGLADIKSEVARHQYHTPKCRATYRRVCEVVQRGKEADIDRTNLQSTLEHILTCEIRRPDPRAEAKLRTLLELVNGDVSFDPLVEIKAESRVEEYVYDVSVPRVERFVGGRAGILLHNSANAAHLRELTTPEAKWLGVWASDINLYRLPYDRLNELDIKRLYELQKDPRYKEKLWKDEIECFLKYKRKAEQEAFARYGLTYIVDKYLPEKLELAKSL